MACIPEHDIDRLKAEVSLVRLIEARGIVLVKQGKDLAGHCPFHRDDTPSLIVTLGKNLYHCFGCNAAGGPIDWVTKLEGVSFRHAVELLRDGVLLVAAPVTESVVAPRTRSTVRKLDARLPMDADDAVALQRVVGFYHEMLNIAFDRHEAGHQAAEALAGKLTAVGIECHQGASKRLCHRAQPDRNRLLAVRQAQAPTANPWLAPVTA